MLFIALSQILFIALLAGTGRLLWAGFRFESPRNPWLLVWLGFFAASTFSMGYALFLPVDEIPFAVFALCGLVGMALIGLDVRRAPPQLPNISRWFWAALILLLFALDYTTTIRVWSMLEGDTGVYHAPLVRWLNEYGTVPGLANLHDLLGNASSWFYFAALIELGPWDGRSAALLPGIGLICGLMYFLHEVIFEKIPASRMYSLVFIGYILILCSRYNRPTLYYDFPALILNGIVILESLRLTLRSPPVSLSRLCLPLCLVAAAFAIKTIPAVSVFMVGGLALWLLWRDSQITIKNFLYVFSLPMVTAIIWLSSNAILSGYPLFPLPLVALPVDWLTPETAVQHVYDAVYGWARLPGVDYRLVLSNDGMWFWLKPWLMRVPVEFPGVVTLPFVLGVVGWSYVLWRRCLHDRVALFFLLWTGFGVAYWFVMAPDIRFGGGLLWSFFACAAVFAVPDSWMGQTRWIHRGVTAVVVVTALALIVRTPTWKETGPQWWIIPPLPAGDIVSYEVKGGIDSFTVWGPPPQSKNYCMNAPLPCTPSPSPNIRMRDPLDMGAGFAPLNPDARYP